MACFADLRRVEPDGLVSLGPSLQDLQQPCVRQRGWACQASGTCSHRPRGDSAHYQVGHQRRGGDFILVKAWVARLSWPGLSAHQKCWQGLAHLNPPGQHSVLGSHPLECLGRLAAGGREATLLHGWSCKGKAAHRAVCPRASTVTSPLSALESRQTPPGERKAATVAER